MRRYLGIDLGIKQVGLAISSSAVLAQPLGCLKVIGDDPNSVITMIKHQCIKYGITHIIIGYPYTNTVHVTTIQHLVKLFVVALKKNFTSIIPATQIILHNEAQSTQRARQQISMCTKKKTKSSIDAVAACLILESYFLQQSCI